MTRLSKIQTNVSHEVKQRLGLLLDELGIGEAEYLRGAILARMRRDTRSQMVTVIKNRVSESRSELTTEDK